MPSFKSYSYPQLVRSFHFTRCGKAMFAFKASLVRFTLYLVDERGWLFCPKLHLLEKFRGTKKIAASGVTLAQKVSHKFFSLEGTMGNNFGRTCCFRFKIQNASLEKNVTA